MTLTAAVREQVFAEFDRADGGGLGLAVSGGGDSMALLALARDWARGRRARIAAVTVDHGLRAEAAGEAARVASFCAEIGVEHTVLRWTGWEGVGNLQDAARRARISLIGGWAVSGGIKHVATGHTLDDQAETLLMRLARGSGVDGLSAIAPVRRANGLTWLRPLLAVSRADLRDHLASEGLPWVEDPSNEDPAFDRVKARRALAELADLGVTVQGLADTATRMGRARVALEQMTAALAGDVARTDRGDLMLDWAGLEAAPEEIRLRLVAAALMWVGGADYRPRASALEAACTAMRAGKTTVLAGCTISAQGGQRRITRELAAVRDATARPGGVWDMRWRVSGPDHPDAEIRALGEDGLRACPDWRESGLPRMSLIASPAVWEAERLIAAPLAGFGQGWSAELITDRADFAETL